MNKRWTSGLIAAAFVSMIALSGCGSSGDSAIAASNNTAASAQNAEGGSGAAAGSSAQNGSPQGRMGGSIGKIKSVSGNTITVYTADMPAGGGKGRGGNGAAGSDGQTPADSGQASADAGQAPAGDAPAPTDGGQSGGPQGRGGGMGGGRQMSFSDETATINITADTKMTSMTMNNGERTETALTVTDLKADDIISYTLTDGTQDAASISVMSQSGGAAAAGN